MSGDWFVVKFSLAEESTTGSSTEGSFCISGSSGTTLPLDPSFDKLSWCKLSASNWDTSCTLLEIKSLVLDLVASAVPFCILTTPSSGGKVPDWSSEFSTKS